MLLKFSNWNSGIQLLTDGVGGCAVSMINLLTNITTRKLSSFLDCSNTEMEEVRNRTCKWICVLVPHFPAVMI